MFITDEPNDGYSDDFDELQCPRCSGQMEYIPAIDKDGRRMEDGPESYCCADCSYWHVFDEMDYGLD